MLWFNDKTDKKIKIKNNTRKKRKKKKEERKKSNKSNKRGIDVYTRKRILKLVKEKSTYETSNYLNILEVDFKKD